MAKYILLKVDDDSQAAALVKQIGKYGMIEVEKEVTAADIEKGDIPGGVEVEVGQLLSEEVPVFVRAVWNVYDYCRCTTKKGWSEGKTSGLWVCAICKRPSQANVRGDGWAGMHGRNLLPISESRPEWRGPSHKNHRGYDPNVDTYTGPMRARARGEV